MKRLLSKISVFAAILFIYNAWKPALGLMELYREHKYPSKNSIKLLEGDESQKKTLIIGCSNLQYNIDKKIFQDQHPHTSFLLFSGNHNSSMFNFLAYEKLLDNYDQIIFYIPYHLFRKNNLMSIDNYHFRKTGCFNYALSVILNDPSYVYYDWKSYNDSISANRSNLSNQINYLADADHRVDSVVANVLAYKECNFPFVREKHIIYFPKLDQNDFDFFRKLMLGKQYKIIFSPVPNIAENSTAIEQKGNTYMRLQNTIGSPFCMDSSLFYNQWYHLNQCGRIIETKRLSQLVSQ